MTQSDDSEGAPVHSDKHEALAVFLGRWRAEGESYGSPKQAVEAPKRVTEPWLSTHTGKWHTGELHL